MNEGYFYDTFWGCLLVAFVEFDLVICVGGCDTVCGF